MNNEQESKQYCIILKPSSKAKLSESVSLKCTANSMSFNSSSRSSSHTTGQIDICLSTYIKNKINEKDQQLAGNLGNKKSSKAKSKVNKKDDSQKEESDKGEDGDSISACPGYKYYSEESMDLLKLLDSMNEELESRVDGQSKQSASAESNDPFSINLKKQAGHISNSNILFYNEVKCLEKQEQSDLTHTTLAQWLAPEGGTNQTKENENVSIEKSVSEEGMQMNKRRRGSSESSSLTSEIKLLTAERARQGWTEQDQAVSIGHLYLLFGCPEVLTLEYSWIANEVIDQEKSDENSSLNDSKDENDSINHVSLLHKFLLAANALLVNHKKQITNTNTLTAKDVSKSETSVQSIKRKRTATTTNPVKQQATNTNAEPTSQVLSTLIHRTILTDELSTHEQFKTPICDNKTCTSNEILPVSVNSSNINSNRQKSNRIILDNEEIEEELNKLRTMKIKKHNKRLSVMGKIGNGSQYYKAFSESNSKHVAQNQLQVTAHKPTSQIFSVPTLNDPTHLSWNNVITIQQSPSLSAENSAGNAQLNVHAITPFFSHNSSSSFSVTSDVS